MTDFCDYCGAWRCVRDDASGNADPEPRACQYACVECGSDLPLNVADCPACLEREQGTAEELSELQQQLEDEDDAAELAIGEADNA